MTLDRANSPSCGSSSIDRSSTIPRSSVALDNHVAEKEDETDRYDVGDAQEPASEMPAPSKDGKNCNQVTWDGPDDPHNPRNWSTPYKLFLTTLGCITALNVTFASSAPTPALTFIAKEFNTSVEVTNLITTLFLVGYITGPVLWGPGSELLGRQLVFRTSMILYTLFILGQALANNIETLLITRLIAGVFAAAPMTNSSAIMADIWAPAARGYAVSFFCVCVFTGPVIGPVEPILVLVTLYLSFIYGILYALFEAVPLVYIGKRGWGLGPDGVAFIAVGLGSCLAAALNFRFSVRFASLMEKWKGFPPPEERLYGAMVAGPCLVIGVLLFGWTGQYPNIHWLAPAFGLVLVGISVGLIFVSLMAYLVDVYLMYSASAMAANTMCRSAIAAAFPLFTVQMFTKLGINWASTLVACIGIVLLPSPFLFYKYGSRIRTGSTFAPCHDLRIAKELEAEGKILV
ncbi:hypothetical protein PILCRDRAFT_828732 [Piloderma croceum F 1598]|uniref:Major facilitator superfamily (MFS) profile domain-containing protein n=1 Tax=Piloderma croceum (strain F 1598) TaxID=765440 RepID=A0A0C3B927_PILCF|nr:hypothetical protein PILCRDRAFT_828732 [Piloderma croceum F 1598]